MVWFCSIVHDALNIMSNLLNEILSSCVEEIDSLFTCVTLISHQDIESLINHDLFDEA
jgi:hypothetical protein